MTPPDENRLDDMLTEAQIWQLALEDTLALNGHLEKIHDVVVKTLVGEAAALIISNPSLSGKLMIVVNEVQNGTVDGQANLLNLAKLAEGRLKMLESEKDG